MADLIARSRWLQRVGRRSAPTRLAVAAVAAALLLAGCSGGDAPEPRGPAPSSSQEQVTGEPSPITRSDALVAQLQADPHFWSSLAGHPVAGSTVLCGIDVLGHDRPRDELYAWVECSVYSTGPHARRLTGGDDPVVLSVADRGAGIEMTGFRLPRTSHYDADLDRLFPPAIGHQIRYRDFAISPTRQELLATARAMPARSSASSWSVSPPSPRPPRTTMERVRRAYGAQAFRTYTGPVPPPISEVEALRLSRGLDDYSLGRWDVGLVHEDGSIDWTPVWVIADEYYVHDVDAGCLGGDMCPTKKTPGWIRAVDMFDARTGEFVIGGTG